MSLGLQSFILKIKAERLSQPSGLPRGRIDVPGLQVCYATALPRVLKAISFDVKQGERVGIVGRTGSGKSTLTLVLLRLLHTQKGCIYIDRVAISTIKVAVLRSKIGFIPQSPTLFEGTIR